MQALVLEHAVFSLNDHQWKNHDGSAQGLQRRGKRAEIGPSTVQKIDAWCGDDRACDGALDRTLHDCTFHVSRVLEERLRR